MTEKTAKIQQHSAASADFAEAVLLGLSQKPKSIPCRYFYDARGSELFEQITGLPEYYPTRTEIALLETHRQEIAALAGPGVCLVEFGSGSSRKTDILIEAMPDLSGYVPIDISGAALSHAASRLAQRFPSLRVAPVHADFNAMRDLPKPLRPLRKLGFFPGSTIGNFDRSEAVAFLQRAAQLLGRNSGFLIGVDLDKSADVLIPAYDDAAGVTAAFNLNLLERINRELEGSFDLSGFAHEAIYNAAKRRIEIYLRSLKQQDVHIFGETFAFAAGERIHTENSHKYTVEGFIALAREAGWCSTHVWTDAGQNFSLHYLNAD